MNRPSEILQKSMLKEWLFIASLYCKRHLWSSALDIYQKALVLQEQQTGPDAELSVAVTLYKMAEAYCEMGHYALAVPIYRRAAGIWEKLQPEDSLSLLWYSDALAKLQLASRDNDDSSQSDISIQTA